MLSRLALIFKFFQRFLLFYPWYPWLKVSQMILGCPDTRYTIRRDLSYIRLLRSRLTRVQINGQYPKFDGINDSIITLLGSSHKIRYSTEHMNFVISIFI